MVRYENPAQGVARIVLDRPSQRNAQNTQLLYELDEMFMKAAQDEDIKVVILTGDGPDFSAGHDLREEDPAIPGRPVATLESDSGAPGVEGRHAFECEVYLGMCRRWRDLPKPTIAQVHGRAIAGALMLIWPMDLIIAGDSALFSDPVVAFGLNGGEYFLHGWEVGPRKAKEMLFTGEPLSADEAHRLGMVNHVVPDSELAEFTLDMARRICRMPSYGLRLAKSSVNGALKTQGQESALDTAFGWHIAGHANNLHRHGSIIDPRGIDMIRDLSKSR
ncbi:enoyl-CoA hydratase [Nocardia donostiensis]|uniref:Enoyl-CoA hydratase n=1 Tax=Nocardia donostiensis TaxID=1538463 RepID=A0A1W0B7F2_9NOCA|nr:enoyl-CoA hydratase [Nocardia donostiensis]OQS13445.1 enoyl-CoA hydratase [Nocardia donostiensis]OQS18455.1 enoyl-CoA hydratase [Nocardia donostiensis]